MAGNKIRGITIELGADTSQFQKEMKGIDKSLNSTERELRDVDKLLKFDPKNTQLLAQKQDLLKSAIGDTEDKLKKEREALEKLKKSDKSPEVEKQMRALERQIVDDEHKMEKFNDELKDTKKASSGLETAKQRFKKFGKGLGVVGKVVGGTVKAGAATVAAIGTAGAVAGKAIGTLANDASKAGDEIDKMSQKVGMSRKGYQEWSFVLSQNGADIKSLQGGMKTLSKNLAMGSDKSVEAVEAIGLSYEQLQSMGREESFNAVITALQGMEDSSMRAAAASQLLGRAGTGLTPLLNQTAESTDELKKKANDLGMVMSDDAVDAAVNFQDQLDGLQRTFETTKNGIMSAMLPAITDLMSGLQMLMIGDNGGAEKVEKGFADLFTNIGKIFEKVGLIVEPLLNALMSVLPSIVEQFTQAIISYLPTIINMLVKVIQAILNAISQNASAFSSAIVQIVMMLVDLIVNNLPLLLQVGITAILALAKGISEALPDLIPVIISLVMSICDMIIQNLPLIIDAGLDIIMGLLDGIVKALPKLLAYIPKLIIKIMKAFTKIIPKLLKFAKDAVKTVMSPFSKLVDFFKGLWQKITDKFKSVGTAIGNAIGGAFKSAINAVLATIENALNFIPNKINQFRDKINKLPGVNIPEMSTVQLPRLAKGGLVTEPTNAIIGEGKHDEAVLPLGDPRTVELFKKAFSGIGTGGTVNQTINVGQMSSYREAYLIKRATEQGLKRMARATQ